jgi:beta-lactamase regulating signal transducer with metallopeptidase domain
MNSLDQRIIDGIGHGWVLMLAFTLALLAVALLRKYCRRTFGAERAFLLWLLLPTAMLASQLPHADNMRVIVLPPVVQSIASAAGALPASAADPVGMTWHAWLVLIWLAGFVLTLARAMVAQARYRARLRGAATVRDLSTRWSILRAVHVDVGPALIGAWRPRIVLPADFDDRYDATERALILAHEAMHARRHDGWWNLCAHAVVALFWFHPLSWLGWYAFRHDQELACDAAVIREHATQRRSYASAMLKTQSATLLLPVGCSWSPRHPITERIAMLKLQAPSRRRKLAGMLVLSFGMTGMAGLVYAASQGSAAVAPMIKVPAEYQLALIVNRGDKTLSNSTICTSGTQPATILQNGLDGIGTWQFTFAVKPAGDGQVQIDVTGSAGESESRSTVKPTLRGPLGKVMLVKVGDAKNNTAPLQLAITPTAGCSAAAASTQSGTITEFVKNGRLRDVAQSVAAKANYVIANPEALDEQLITFNFEKIPIEKALALIAALDGKNAVFHGKQVRFEPVSGG